MACSVHVDVMIYDVLRNQMSPHVRGALLNSFSYRSLARQCDAPRFCRTYSRWINHSTYEVRDTFKVTTYTYYYSTVRMRN